MNEFEIGSIRPPSEANSLLLRVTRNCPWNKCRFCRLYNQVNPDFVRIRTFVSLPGTGLLDDLNAGLIEECADWEKCCPYLKPMKRSMCRNSTDTRSPAIWGW